MLFTIIFLQYFLKVYGSPILNLFFPCSLPYPKLPLLSCDIEQEKKNNFFFFQTWKQRHCTYLSFSALTILHKHRGSAASFSSIREKLWKWTWATSFYIQRSKKEQLTFQIQEAYYKTITLLYGPSLGTRHCLPGHVFITNWSLDWIIPCHRLTWMHETGPQQGVKNSYLQLQSNALFSQPYFCSSAWALIF